MSLEPELREVCEDVYAYLQPDGSWYLNNTGFLVSGTGVISVDATSTERRTRAYLDAIATVTDKPVRTLVNTHHHGDHTHGNYLMSGATIVGHERCREAIRTRPIPPPPGIWSEVDWGHLEPAPPFLTYANGVTVWSGDLRCEVRYVGTPAHTTNDSIVLHPRPRRGVRRRPAVQRRHPVRADGFGQRLDRGAGDGAPPARRAHPRPRPWPGLRPRGHRRRAGLPAASSRISPARPRRPA